MENFVAISLALVNMTTILITRSKEIATSPEAAFNSLVHEGDSQRRVRTAGACWEGFLFNKLAGRKGVNGLCS